MNAIATIDKENQANLSDYLSKKKAADAIVAKNLLIQKSNDEGLAKVKAENAAITKRNQEGQATIDAVNKAGQVAVNQENQANQKLVPDRANEIDVITKRNQEKEDTAKKENEAIDAYNTKEMDRYKRDLAETSKGEEGYISEALTQALNLNKGESQARHSADTRNPNRIIAKGDPILGGYSKILDSTVFFVYDTSKIGETLSFTYQQLQNARFDGKKITKVAYDFTNLVAPAGTNAVQLVVPNAPTEGFIFVVLYQIFKAISSFFLIGVIGGLDFIEVYGTYLFFTERYLFTEDLATNGMWSFTSFYLVFNLLIVLGIVTKVIRSKVA